ncbi:hypothetical protein EV361DRAFT_796272, partial [Lentinula raphanica]
MTCPSLLELQPIEDSFKKDIRRLYSEDPLFMKVLLNPQDHSAFQVEEGMIYTKNRNGETVMCIPKGCSSENGKSLRGIVIEQAHEILGHFGGQRTSDYVRCWYWW